MNAAQFQNRFPLGSHLCREPMPPMSELKRDMAILKKHGFNLIKLQEHWMIDEPHEGQCNFSRYEELIAHAATLDMGVYLGLTCEQAPHWLYEKHPDCRMVRRDGVVVAHEAQTTLCGSDGKPGPCFDHPGAMSDHLRFITRLVQCLGRFENVVIWNTWQEVGYWPEMILGSHVCYCPNTLNAYRAWLRGKYGDLDALNRAWNSRYANWHDVRPNQTAAATTSAQEMYWRHFMDNAQIAHVLKSRADAVRAADPLKRPVFAHKGGPIIGSGQDWTYARSQDFLGSSCYPSWGWGEPWDDGMIRPYQRTAALVGEMWDRMTLKYDYIRSCNPGDGRAGGAPVWAAEFQGGPVNTGFHKGRVPSPADIRRWMLSGVGAGMTACCFWVTRAEIMAAEQNGFSLLDSTGDTTLRFEEASRVGRALQKHPDLFAKPTFQPASVGILISEDNFQYTRLPGQGTRHQPYSVRGWHRLLWELNVPADFVNVDHDMDAAGSYTVLILPFPQLMSESLAEKLTRFVEGGGCLISEAAPGRVNEHLYCPRGEMSPAMAKLLGVRQTGFTMVREPDNGSRWSFPERTWGEYRDATMLQGTGPLAGHRVRANVYVQAVSPDDSEAVLYAGDEVAGTRRHVGRGQAWLIGTYLGHSGTAYRDPAVHQAVRAMLAACDVHSQHPGPVILRKRMIEGKQAWLLTNPTDQPVAQTIDVAGWDRVTDLLDEPIAREGDTVKLTVPPLDVRVLVLERL